MKYIDKTVINDTKPKTNNVNWIDTSQNPPVLKSFINGRYIQVSGGGSGNVSDGIPVNQLTPTPMRDITEEDLQKLPEPEEGFAFYKAIDLQDGIVPYFILFDDSGDICVVQLHDVVNEEIRYFDPMNGSRYYFAISSDKKFIALYEEEHNENPGGSGGNKI